LRPVLVAIRRVLTSRLKTRRRPILSRFVMKPGASLSMIFFVALIVALGAVIGILPLVKTPTRETSAAVSMILPAGTVFKVSSSFDCVAGHYSLNFSAPEQSALVGGFRADAPGVTAYVATSQQANSTIDGHPVSWVYSTGLVNSSHISLLLSPGSYVLWVEGADQNCGAGIVTPLEILTQVTVTDGFVVTAQSAGGVDVKLGLSSHRVASGTTLNVSVSDFNSSPSVLNLSSEDAWALNGLSTGGCPSLYYPFGIAVYQGVYTEANASHAVPLRIFPETPCPLLVRYITGYLFSPGSDGAVVLPGTGEVPMATTVYLRGTYVVGGNQSRVPIPFALGTYTVVAGDEWGHLGFAYFDVTPSSNGAAEYAYQTVTLRD